MPAPVPRTPDEVVGFFGSRLPPERAWYLRYNARRYAWLVRYVEKLLVAIRARKGDRAPRILDVGSSFQTALLRQLLPDGEVDVLGLVDPAFPVPEGGRHIAFDLNLAGDRSRWPPIAGYDLILIAEVIEHLWVGAGAVLASLSSGLETGGYLVVQTPNAVALHKRLRMLAGRSPIAPLPDDRPGEPHLHEYTLGELLDAGRRAELELVETCSGNYFGIGPIAAAYTTLGRVMPASLCHGMTVTFRRAASPSPGQARAE